MAERRGRIVRARNSFASGRAWRSADAPVGCDIAWAPDRWPGEVARRAKQLSPTQTVSDAMLAYALVGAGREGECRALLADLKKLGETRFVPPYHMAHIHNALGETDRVFEWLEKGFRERDPKMTFLKVEPRWNDQRSDPRLQSLLERMNFPQ